MMAIFNKDEIELLLTCICSNRMAVEETFLRGVKEMETFGTSVRAIAEGFVKEMENLDALEEYVKNLTPVAREPE